MYPKEFKMDNKTFLRTVLTVSVLSIAAVPLFKLPAFTNLFDLSGNATANIANMIQPGLS